MACTLDPVNGPWPPHARRPQPPSDLPPNPLPAPVVLLPWLRGKRPRAKTDASSAKRAGSPARPNRTSAPTGSKKQ